MINKIIPPSTNPLPKMIKANKNQAKEIFCNVHAFITKDNIDKKNIIIFFTNSL